MKKTGRTFGDTSFIDGQGYKVMPAKVKLPIKNVGEAYAVFSCKSAKDKVAIESQDARRIMQADSGLELSLVRGLDVLESKPQLLREVEISGLQDDSYVLKARGYGMNSRKAAQELSAVMNGLYASPLYQKGEKMHARLFYEEDNQIQETF